MKKIIAQNVFKSHFETPGGPLARPQVALFYAPTLDDILAVHRRVRGDIIVADFSAGGTLTGSIRPFVKRVEATRKAGVIAACEDSDLSIEECRKAGAAFCIKSPVNSVALTEAAMDLMDIPTRKSFRVFIQVSVKGETTKGVFFATAENISTSGILVQTDKELTVGDRVACSFFMRSSEITLQGEVMRTEPSEGDAFRYGIQFVELDATTRARIEDYVRGNRSN
ncbi:MAG: PilZ domain-containing protein [Thermodesulfovibrionales bacterium]